MEEKEITLKDILELHKANLELQKQTLELLKVALEVLGANKPDEFTVTPFTTQPLPTPWPPQPSVWTSPNFSGGYFNSYGGNYMYGDGSYVAPTPTPPLVGMQTSGYIWVNSSKD